MVAKADIPQRTIIFLAWCFLKLMEIVWILISFPVNYIFFGWKRTVCALIHCILLENEREFDGPTWKCQKCGLIHDRRYWGEGGGGNASWG